MTLSHQTALPISFKGTILVFLFYVVGFFFFLAGKCVKEKLKLKAQGHIPDCRTSSNSKTTKPNTKRAAH